MKAPMASLLRSLCIVTSALMCFLIVSYSCHGSNNDIVEDDEFYKYDEPSETIAIFGDIQYYTNAHYINLFKQSLDWLKSNKDRLNIKCILHTGDVTQTNDAGTEWPFFYKATRSISSTIPFISLIGDHDYSWDHAFINDRDDTHFSDFVKFPIVINNIEAAFEEERMENIVVHNTIHGERYDILLLEFGPRKEVVDWAVKWVSSHPDIKFILMNHEYLEKGGGRRVKGLKCRARLKNTTYTTPEELWNKLVRCNDNIMCVLCGHVGGLYAITFDTNDFGREVPQIQHNIQGSDFRYDNWIMLWQFPNNSDSTIVHIVNARTNTEYGGSKNLFSFKYRY